MLGNSTLVNFGMFENSDQDYQTDSKVLDWFKKFELHFDTYFLVYHHFIKGVPVC